MTPDEIDAILDATLTDRRVTRSEKRALAEVIGERVTDDETRALLRSRAFELARRAVSGRVAPHEARELIDWLEDVTKLALPISTRPSAIAEVLESPGDACWRRIVELIDAASRTIDACVFTITDDRISRALLEAHRRGVRLRVMTDDDKATERGSDAARLAGRGVRVRTDRSEDHMHHKFCVLDRRIALTGSYNWTRAAAERNQENLLVTDDPRVVTRYAEIFETLWDGGI